MALDCRAVSCRNHETADHQANLASHAVGKFQHPERHGYKQDVHVDGPSCPLSLTIRPMPHRIPKKVDPTDKTEDGQNVLARRNPRKRSDTCPGIVLFAHFGVVLDEEYGKRNQHKEKAPKQRTYGLHWTRIRQNDEDCQVIAEVSKPPLEGDDWEIGPYYAYQGECNECYEDRVACKKLTPSEGP